MSTQLRLISRHESPEGPEVPERATAAGRTEERTTPAAHGRGARHEGGRSSTRRVVHRQEQWRLDDRTRAVGRAGVASARAALARALPEADLRQAS